MILRRFNLRLNYDGAAHNFIIIYANIVLFSHCRMLNMLYTKVPDNELKMVTEEFVNRNSSLSVYNESISNWWSVTKC